MIEISTLFQGIVLVAWTSQFGASTYSLVALGVTLFVGGSVAAGLTYDLFKKLWANTWPAFTVILCVLVALYAQEIKTLIEVVKPLLFKN
jgi:hypothetical protein